MRSVDAATGLVTVEHGMTARRPVRGPRQPWPRADEHGRHQGADRDGGDLHLDARHRPRVGRAHRLRPRAGDRAGRRQRGHVRTGRRPLRGGPGVGGRPGRGHRRDPPDRAGLPAPGPRGADAVGRGPRLLRRVLRGQRALGVLLVPAHRGLPGEAQQPIGRPGRTAVVAAALARRRVPVQHGVRRRQPVRSRGAARRAVRQQGLGAGAVGARVHDPLLRRLHLAAPGALLRDGVRRPAHRGRLGAARAQGAHRGLGLADLVPDRGPGRPCRRRLALDLARTRHLLHRLPRVRAHRPRPVLPRGRGAA